jgi:hypothetical protein
MRRLKNKIGKYFFIHREINDTGTYYTIMLFERYWMIRIVRMRILYED